MAGLNGSLQSNSQFPGADPSKRSLLQLTTETFFMERRPKYESYADLRESRLRMKNKTQPQEEPNLTPPRKQVKFQGSFAATPTRRNESSVLTQSVPDFSSALRKENRRPTTMLPPLTEKSMTPPTGSKSSKMHGIGANLGGASPNSGEKRKGELMARKSYANNVEELKGSSFGTDSAIIKGENRGGTIGKRIGKSVLGCRQY